MSGFAYRKNLDGSAYNPINMRLLGKNSIQFSVGDLIRVNTSGNIDLSDSTEGVAGVVVTVEDANGLPVDPDSGTTETWTMSSTNTTVALHKVVFIPALPNYLFYNDSDGTLTDTNLFQYADVASSQQVTTGGFTDTATKQVRLIERDPDGDADASKGLFQIVESQFAPISIGNTA